MTLDIRNLQDALTALGITSLDSLLIMAARELADQHYPHLDPSQPTLLMGPARGTTIEKIAATLAAAFPPDHAISRLAGESRQDLSLVDLNTMGELDEGDCVWIPPLTTAGSYTALQDVIAHLRSPDGCPWDRELTWAKLRASLLEESYELLAALDAGEPAKVAEELGDLLLQIGLQTQIATEEGFFRLPDVIEGIVSKLIRRHPHVFSTVEVSGTDEVLANWEEIKRLERARNGERRSPLTGVPAGLPALAQAEAYLDRLSRLQTIDVPGAPWEKLATLPDTSALSPELVGEVLFGMVAWARARGIDPESTLRETNARYAAVVEQAESASEA